MFVILTMPRTGSELLVSALMNHPKLRVESELLNPNRYHDWRKPILNRLFNITDLQRLALPRVAFEQDKRLAVLVHQILNREVDGFKISYDQLDHTSPVVSVLHRFHSLRVVFMRRNWLDSAVSYWFATNSGLWQRTKGELFDDEPQLVDQKFVANYCRIAAIENDFYQKLFTDHHCLTVDYTELIDSWQQTTDTVQEFLGVEQAVLPIAFDKRLRRSLSELVLNWDELQVYR